MTNNLYENNENTCSCFLAPQNDIALPGHLELQVPYNDLVYVLLKHHFPGLNLICVRICYSSSIDIINILN